MFGSTSQKLEKVGPLIEKYVRGEVGATAPLPYEVEGAGDASKGSVFWRDIWGGSAVVLFYLHFDLPGLRPAHLRITMIKRAIGCVTGLLFYTAQLSKTVTGEVELDEPRLWRTSKFIGDQNVCDKLNTNGKLLTLANKFPQRKMDLGSSTLRIPRILGVTPQDSGTLFFAGTLPKESLVKGFSFQIKQFFDLASMLEATL